MMLGLLALLGGCSRSPEAKKARYLERGDQYFKQNKHREAVLEYRNALRIDSKDPKAIRQLALSYYELGQLNQAFRFLLWAQEIEPDNDQLALKLATIYLLGGRPDDAQATAQVTQTLVVGANGSGATAQLTVTPSAPRINQRTSFDASASTPSTGASIISYKFNYGDGTEEVTANPVQSYTYTTPGTVLVSVEITDSNGKTSTKVLTLNVGS